MTQSSPDSAQLPLSPELVLKAAREVKSHLHSLNKPYSAGVVDDCILTIENLLSRLSADIDVNAEMFSRINSARYPDPSGTAENAWNEALAHIEEGLNAHPIAAARSSAASAGTPLRLCGLCHTWNSKPCGEQCGWSPSDPPDAAQPSAEIADIVHDLLHNKKTIGVFPIYQIEDDRGLEESEYLDFAKQVVARLHDPAQPAPDRMAIAQIICCGKRCILEDTEGGCILNQPEHDGDLKKADAILALSVAPPAAKETLLGDTHWCGHGMMASICPTCSVSSTEGK